MFFFSSEQLSAPFEIGITLREEDFEEYGVVLQEIIQRLLGNEDAAGFSNSSFIHKKSCFQPMYIKIIKLTIF